MPDWRCPYCNSPVNRQGAEAEPEQNCPHCGRGFSQAVNAAADTVPAVLEDDEGSRASGRPARPIFMGRTFVFEMRGGEPAGCGCLAGGCLLLLLLAGLVLRGCISLLR